MTTASREVRFRREQVKPTEDGESLVLEGYATTFNEPYLIRGEEGDFWEIVRPGAFRRSLERAAARFGSGILALNGHDTKFVIGNTKNGTLTLREDGTGLWCRMVLPPVADARDLLTRVKLGYVDGMSHGFDVADEDGVPGDRMEWRNGRVERDLLNLELFEVTVTAIPANDGTSVWASSRARESAKEIRERAASLREADATAIPVPAIGDPIEPIAWLIPPR